MSHPFVTPFTVEHSCSECPAGSSTSFTTVENDEISCNGNCPTLMYFDGSNGCNDCPAGKVGSSAGICTDCSLGMYSILPASLKCENCLGGKSTVAEGGSKTTDCKDCQAGKHSTGKDDFTTCKDCDKDSYSDIGSSVCLKCDPGQYMPAGSPRSCSNCTAGKFSNYGKVECTDCVQGYYADKTIAATECISCPSGQYGSGVIVAQRINEGDACNKCVTGKYSKAKGADSDETCIDCQPGKKAKDVEAATEETEACTNCLVGQYRSSTDTDLTKCIDCPTGKTLGAEGGSKCIDCIPGRFSGAVGSKSIDCGKCPVGYSTEEGAGTDTIPTKDKCVACLLGTYADTEGLTKCSACAAGKFSDVHVKDGEDFCKDCVVGQHRPSKDEDGVDTDLTKCK